MSAAVLEDVPPALVDPREPRAFGSPTTHGRPTATRRARAGTWRPRPEPRASAVDRRCRGCGGELVPTGRPGRPSAYCSAECRRESRSADAYARRHGDAPEPVPSVRDWTPAPTTTSTSVVTVEGSPAARAAAFEEVTESAPMTSDTWHTREREPRDRDRAYRWVLDNFGRDVAEAFFRGETIDGTRGAV